MVFGTVILNPQSPSDLWVSFGISQLLCDNWLKQLHGENWSKTRAREKMEQLCSVEVDSPALSIAGPIDDLGNATYSVGGSFVIKSTNEKGSALDGILSEESFYGFYLLKSGLVFKAIEQRIGTYALTKSFSTLVSFIHAQSSYKNNSESNSSAFSHLADHEEGSLENNSKPSLSTTAPLITIVSSAQFFRLIRKVSGKDLRSFAEQWIYSPGHAIISASFGLNRKKCCLEIRISQECTHPDRGSKFCGPLKIRAQESDRSYDHVVHVEEASHFFELPYHSKYKKSTAGGSVASLTSGGIPTSHAPIHLQPIEESTTTILSSDKVFSDESPVLWVRIDPDMEWLRVINIEQPEFMWLDQLENDRDVTSQAEAIHALSLIPSESLFSVFERVISNWKNYYKIRVLAITAIASMSSTLPHMRNEIISILMGIYESKFALPRQSTDEALVPKPNMFETLPLYFVLCSLIRVIGKIKDDHGKTPPELIQFLLHLLRFNDNSQNKYSDDNYLSVLLTSLIDSLIPASVELFCRPDPSILKSCLEELERYRFLDIIRPSHNNLGLIRLQLAGLVPLDERVFTDLVLPGNGHLVRETALRGLLLLRHGDESFIRDLLTDISSYAINGKFAVSDSIYFQQSLFKLLKELTIISSHFSSNLHARPIQEVLESLLVGALLCRNLFIFDSLISLCQISFSQRQLKGSNPNPSFMIIDSES